MICLVLLACKELALPPLPEPVLGGFAPPVREQVRAALARAEAAPRNASAVGDLGRVLFVYGQFEAAVQCFQRCFLVAPEEFQWAYLLGVARASLGQAEEARAAFEAAAAMRPSDLPTAIRLADLLEQSGAAAEAREVLEGILQASPRSAAARFRLGRLVAPTQPGMAVEHLQEALEADSDYREARYALANAYRLQGRQEDADRQLELYEAADPVPRRHFADPLVDSMDSIKTASVQEVFNDGRAKQDAGDIAGARAAYLAALEIDPNYVQAHVNLVAVHGELGDHEQAAMHYRRSVALNPSIAEAHYNYGVSRHFSGDFAGAAEAFRKAVAINPQNADSHGNLATALDELGQAAEAGRHYRLALENDPSHPQANFHVGRRLVDRGRYREAVPYLEKALERETAGTPLHGFLLALVYRHLGQADRALDLGRVALRGAAARGHTELARKIENELGIRRDN